MCKRYRDVISITFRCLVSLALDFQNTQSIMSATTNKALNILITGGARGIGRGLFRQFLAKGHRVFILDNNTEELEHVKSRADK